MFENKSKNQEELKKEEFNRIKSQSFITTEELLIKDENGDYLGGNSDLLDRLLVYANQDQLKEILKYIHAIGSTEAKIEDIEVAAYYARLRYQTHREMDLARQNRNITALSKTDFEEKAGILIEQIEPQVRRAVISLNAKGYKTKGSGFYGHGSQQIYLNRGQVDQAFDSYRPSNELVKWLNTKNIQLEVEPGSITYATKNRLTLAELEEVWNMVVDDIPSVKNEQGL